MEVLTAVAVDVSGSMLSCVPDPRGREGGEWARSIFSVLDNLVKHDVSSRNKVFALGFGASKAPYSFDLLNTIQEYPKKCQAQSQPKRQAQYSKRSHTQTIECILSILERPDRAPRVRKWASVDNLRKHINEADAEQFLEQLENDSEFLERFVEILPESCRRVESHFNEVGFFAVGLFGMQDVATKGRIIEVVEKGKQLLKERVITELESGEMDVTFEEIGPQSIADVHAAQAILHGSVGQEELTNERIDELMKIVEPAIYGGTPMTECLNAAVELFATPEYREHKKLLFILSDGEPDDKSYLPKHRLDALHVQTIGCFITSGSAIDPKHLYSKEDDNWCNGAKYMFQISSTITSQNIPRTIFVKRGWKIDIEDNETRLFVQVNHPDILDDVCDLARDVVCSQDALSDALSSVDLDLYINKANQSFVHADRIGGTSYTNAIATVLHLAMKRIIEREGEVPDFFQIRDEVTQVHDKHRTDTVSALREVCSNPKYRLQFKEVDTRGALEAIIEKRPVIAQFLLSDMEINSVSEFFQRDPRGILSKADLMYTYGRRDQLHAAVLTSFDSQSLRLMTSKGDNWGDGGFFRITNAGVLDLKFFDVNTAYLTPSEKAASELHGPEVARKLIARLKGLQVAQYVCPKCHRSSSLSDFTGHALETKCPKCRSKFRFEKSGEDLALNLYLLSLSTPKRRE